jgi:hypothetical protein
LFLFIYLFFLNIFLKALIHSWPVTPSCTRTTSSHPSSNSHFYFK